MAFVSLVFSVVGFADTIRTAGLLHKFKSLPPGMQSTLNSMGRNGVMVLEHCDAAGLEVLTKSRYTAKMVETLDINQLGKALKLNNVDAVIDELGLEKVQRLVDAPDNMVVSQVTGKGQEIIYRNKDNTVVRWYMNRHETTLETAIESAKKSITDGRNVEGAVADYIWKIDKSQIQGFGLQIENLSTGKPAGDIDILTKGYFIEAKSSIGSVKVEQIRKYIDESNPQFFNQERKKVILYIEGGFRNDHWKIKELRIT